MKKERFDYLVNAGVYNREDDIVILTDITNGLLEALYKPTLTGIRIDTGRIRKFKIDRTEPVNWGGGLYATVDKEADGYLITVEEAAPDECDTLCDYVEKYLTAWGWPVKVVTEW